MKKLVVLALVLAISGVASATLSFSFVATDRDLVAPGLQVLASDMVTITVVASNNNLANTMLFIGQSGPAILSLVDPQFNSVVTATGGANGGLLADITIIDDGEGGTMNFANTFGLVQLFAADCGIPGVGALIANGPAVGTIQLHAEGAGDVVLKMWDNDSMVQYDMQTINVIPEPMTLGLLGLGGLFLRRRLA